MGYKRFFKRSSLKESEYKGDKYYDHHAHDEHMMREIELFLENDGQLYHSQFIPIIKNIKRKISSGKYNHSQAPKLWMYYVENGLKKYAKDNDGRWNTLLSTSDRKILAQKLADYYYDEIQNGNYDTI